jgi:hypothetical protein
MQGHVDLAVKDKRQAMSDLDSLRERLNDALRDKTEVEQNFNLIQSHEMNRLNELESKFETISL